MRKDCYTLPISMWAAEDRPSDKMARLGISALSSAELLSIIIGSGSGKQSAVELSKMLLAKNGQSLRQLMHQEEDALAQLHGIGKAKAAKILAALELGKRMMEEQVSERRELSCAVRVYNYMLPHITGYDHERFWVVFCDQRYHLIQQKCMFVGGITEVAVDIRVILRAALMCKATIIYVVHNHPSGSLSPSKYDDNLTQDIRKACEAVRVHFADHIIMTEGDYYSYHEQGKL